MIDISVDTYITLLFPFERELLPYTHDVERDLLDIPFEIGQEFGEIAEHWKHVVTSRVVYVNGMVSDSYAPLGLPIDTIRSRLYALRAGAVLHLSTVATIEIPDRRSFPQPDGTELVMNRPELESLYRQELVRAANDVNGKLILVLNLGRPGIFDIGPSFSTDGTFIESSGVILSNLGFVAKLARKDRWPMLDPIAFRRIWEWVHAGDYTNGLGQTRVERGFNAYTRLFGDVAKSDGSEELFWSLMGLEALFCDGTGSTMNQVVARSQLLLGVHAPLKKAFNRAYAVRSAFIHGGLPFPGQFFEFDVSTVFADFSQKTSDATTVAETILVASLRELVLRRWHSIEFTTQLVGSTSRS